MVMRMEEEIVFESYVKGDLGESAVERFFKSNQFSYERREPIGIGHKNCDFRVDGLGFVEVKNWNSAMSRSSFLKKVLDKFLTDDPVHSGEWILVVSNANEDVKRICKDNGIKLVEMGEQAVDEDGIGRWVKKLGFYLIASLISSRISNSLIHPSRTIVSRSNEAPTICIMPEKQKKNSASRIIKHFGKTWISSRILISSSSDCVSSGKNRINFDKGEERGEKEEKHHYCNDFAMLQRVHPKLHSVCSQFKAFAKMNDTIEMEGMSISNAKLEPEGANYVAMEKTGASHHL